ncbi:hypothetical protein X975_08796, partial [Stegodyphus mimosarum]
EDYDDIRLFLSITFHHCQEITSQSFFSSEIFFIIIIFHYFCEKITSYSSTKYSL